MLSGVGWQACWQADWVPVPAFNPLEEAWNLGWEAGRLQDQIDGLKKKKADGSYDEKPSYQTESLSLLLLLLFSLSLFLSPSLSCFPFVYE